MIILEPFMCSPLTEFQQVVLFLFTCIGILNNYYIFVCFFLYLKHKWLYKTEVPWSIKYAMMYPQMHSTCYHDIIKQLKSI